MNRPPAVIAFVLAEPFDDAVQTLRGAFHKAELTVVTELGVSERLKRQLGLGLAPCRILLVDSPYLMLESVAQDRSTAVLLPLHLVVSGRGPQTLVNCLNPALLNAVELPSGTAGPLAKLLAELTRALETVAIPLEQHQSVS